MKLLYLETYPQTHVLPLQELSVWLKKIDLLAFLVSICNMLYYNYWGFNRKLLLIDFKDVKHKYKAWCLSKKMSTQT